jgi:hypothetical protein
MTLLPTAMATGSGITSSMSTHASASTSGSSNPSSGSHSGSFSTTNLHLPPSSQPSSHQTVHQQTPATGGTSVYLPSKLAIVNEQTWIQLGTSFIEEKFEPLYNPFHHLGSLSEALLENDKAIHSYEMALCHNPLSVVALQRLGTILKSKELYLQVPCLCC